MRFTSPFIENRVSVHCRALHPTEDVDAAADGILALLSECGIAHVAVLPEVVDHAAFARSPAAPIH